MGKGGTLGDDIMLWYVLIGFKIIISFWVTQGETFIIHRSGVSSKQVLFSLTNKSHREVPAAKNLTMRMPCGNSSWKFTGYCLQVSC